MEWYLMAVSSGWYGCCLEMCVMGVLYKQSTLDDDASIVCAMDCVPYILLSQNGEYSTPVLRLYKYRHGTGGACTGNVL